MGLLEKRRFKNFVVWANDYDEKQPSTHKGMCIYMYMYLSTVCNVHIIYKIEMFVHVHV